MTGFEVCGFCGFVVYPYTLEELASKLGRVLGGNPIRETINLHIMFLLIQASPK